MRLANRLKAMCLKNGIIYVRLRQYIGTIIALLLIGLLPLLRSIAVKKVEPKTYAYGFWEMPSPNSITQTYLAHLCHPYFDPIFSSLPTQASYENIIKELVQYLKSKQADFDVKFGELIDSGANNGSGANATLDVAALCTDFPQTSPLHNFKAAIDKVKFDHKLLNQKYTEKQFPRCFDYNGLDNTLYSISQRRIAVHALSSTVLPIHFRNSPTGSSTPLRATLESFDSVKFVADQLLPPGTENDSDLTDYRYCVKSRKLRFQQFDSEDQVRRALDRHHEVPFGIVVDEQIGKGTANATGLHGVRFLTRFENLNASLDRTLANISDKTFFEERMTWSGIDYVSHILYTSIMYQENQTQAAKFRNTFVARPPYRDASNLNMDTIAQVLRNVPNIFVLVTLPMDGILLYAMSKEKERRIPKYLAKLGVRMCDFTSTWCLFWLLHHSIILLIFMCALKWSKMLNYVELSVLVLYSFTLSLSQTFLAILLTAVSDAFAINLLVYISISSATSMPASFKPYLPAPFRQFIQLFPAVNIGQFLQELTEYESRKITVTLSILKDRFYDNSNRLYMFYILNLVAATLSGLLYLLIIYLDFNNVSMLSCIKRNGSHLINRIRQKEKIASLKVRTQFSDPNNENILEVKNLHKSYGDHKVLKGVNFCTRKGEITMFLGRNGAGKTTLVDCLLGTQGFDKGEIQFNSANSLKGELDIAYVPQFDFNYKSATPSDQFRIFGTLLGYTSAEISESLDNWLEIFGIEEFKHSNIDKFSGGMRRKTTIASILALNPKTVFLDEPTASLDPNSKANIHAIIDDLCTSKGLTFMITSHTPDEVQVLSSKLIIIDNGTIVESGPYNDVIARNGLRTRFSILRSKSKLQKDEIEKSTKEIAKRTNSTIVCSDNHSDVFEMSSSEVTPSWIDKFSNQMAKQKDVKSFTMKEVSAEDIFMGVIEKSQRNEGRDKQALVPGLTTTNIELQMYSGWRHSCQKFAALFYRLFVEFFTFYKCLFLVIVPILISLFFQLITYAEKNGHFSLNNEDYLISATPGFLLAATNPINFQSLRTFSHFTNTFRSNNDLGNLATYLENNTTRLKSVHCLTALNSTLSDRRANGQCESVINSPIISTTTDFFKTLIDGYSGVDLLGGVYGDSITIDQNAFPFIVYYNGNSSRNSSIVVLNHYANSILYHITTQNLSKGIRFEMQVYENYSRSSLSNQILSLILIISLCINIFFVPTFLTILIYRDKSSSLKHFLMTQGIPMIFYWSSILIFYMMVFTCLVWITCGIIKLFPGVSVFGKNIYTIFALQNVYLLNSIMLLIICVLCCGSEFSSSLGFFGFQINLGLYLGIVINILKVKNFTNKDSFAHKFEKYFHIPVFKFMASSLTVANADFSDMSSADITNHYKWDLAQQVIYFLIQFTAILVYEHWHYLKAFCKQNRSKYSEQDTAVLRANNVSKTYYLAPIKCLSCCFGFIPVCLKDRLYSEKNKLRANKDITVAIMPGENTALIGTNGSGKTTFGQMIINEIPPTSGKILLKGKPINYEENMNRRIGFCPQKPILPELLTVEQILNLFYMIYGVKFSELAEARRVNMDDYGFSNLAQKKPSELSGGGRKIVALSLLSPSGMGTQKPAILFLDEVLASLDMIKMQLVRQFMEKQKEFGRAVLYTTHNFVEIENSKGNLIVLHKGDVLFTGLSSEFFSKFPNLLGLKIRFHHSSTAKSRKAFNDAILQCGNMNMRSSFSNQTIFDLKVDANAPQSALKSAVLLVLRDISKVLKSQEDNNPKSSAVKSLAAISIGPQDLEALFCDNQET